MRAEVDHKRGLQVSPANAVGQDLGPISSRCSASGSLRSSRRSSWGDSCARRRLDPVDVRDRLLPREGATFVTPADRSVSRGWRSSRTVGSLRSSPCRPTAGDSDAATRHDERASAARDRRRAAPFWSPESVAFFARRETEGGGCGRRHAAESSAESIGSGSWNRENTIVLRVLSA